jgi:hypothetical protein
MSVNLPRFFCAVLFYWHMNEYYGWNRSPQSPDELLADGIFVLLFALSFNRETPK